MQWFVNLDGPLQQTFILNLLQERLRGAHSKSEDSIGLLSMKEGDASYLIKDVDSLTIQDLRNVCSSKRVKFISTKDEILFDIGHGNEGAHNEIQLILEETSPKLTMGEVSFIPATLKNEFYRLLQSSGQMRGGGGGK